MKLPTKHPTRPAGTLAGLRYAVATVAFAVLALSACAPLMRIDRQKEVICPPPPPQDCRPMQWIGAVFDTSASKLADTGYHLTIEPLTTMNTPEDELHLFFATPERGFATVWRGSSNTVRRFTIAAKTIGKFGRAALLDSITAGGAVSLIGTKGVMSAATPEKLLGDQNLVEIERVDSGIRIVRECGANVNVPVNWESQPALTPDGRVMFFASEREGGLGGTDIWFSIRSAAGEWSRPFNCGPAINSRCDEITPFVTADGKRLLFSSNGRESVGGYDIFIAQIGANFAGFVADTSNSAMSLPFVLGMARNYAAPLNTVYDEIFPSTPSDPDTLLYYSANQPAEEGQPNAGGFDFYILHRVPFGYGKDRRLTAMERLQRYNLDSLSLSEDPTATLEGKVYQTETKSPVTDADVSVKNLENQKIVGLTTTDTTGKYRVKVPVDKDLEITAQTEDLFYDTYKIRVRPEDSGRVFLRDLYVPAKLFLRVNFPTDVYLDPYAYILDSNGVESLQTWQEAINLLAENILRYREKIRQITLTGHTDDVASVAYNQALGERRVNFVVEELVKRGVPREMLAAKSAGELEPLPKKDGEYIDMYRKRLRRVELTKVMQAKTP